MPCCAVPCCAVPCTPIYCSPAPPPLEGGDMKKCRRSAVQCRGVPCSAVLSCPLLPCPLALWPGDPDTGRGAKGTAAVRCGAD